MYFQEINAPLQSTIKDVKMRLKLKTLLLERPAPHKIKSQPIPEPPKLNTNQIKELVEKIADAVTNPSEAVADNTVNNSVADKDKYEHESKGAFLGHLFKELSLAHHRSLIVFIENSCKPSYSPESQSNLDYSTFIKEYEKSIKLERSQLKNLIKRWIIWLRQKPNKAISAVKTLIKFIITPRLFGIYVSEEDNNRLAVFSFSNC